MTNFQDIFRFFMAMIFVMFQQAVVITIGLVVYAQSGLGWGCFCWFFCIPMIWLNFVTFKHVTKYGMVKSTGDTTDTSSIDVR